MDIRIAGKTAGIIMLLEALFMASSMVISLIYRESIAPFAYSIAILLILGIPMYYLNKKSGDKYSSKGAFITVGLSWILLSACGALPFYFCGDMGNYIDCFFEAVSGFTTTGATVLAEVENLPRGILWWRSFTHFLGGMGILVLINAIMPSSKDKSHHLLRAEVPGPSSDKLVPKLSTSSKILYCIYAGLTLVQVIALLISGIGLYDAFTIAFSTAGTGGFAVKNASIAGYMNPAAEYITGVFMLVFSVNFGVYFLILTGKVRQALRSEELRFFLCAVSAAVAIVVIDNLKRYGLADAFRYSFFTVSSIVSTTGFSNVDFSVWRDISKAVIVMLMFCGACAGSTGGGLKMSRVSIMLKVFVQDIKEYIHPRAVSVIRYDGKIVSEKMVSGIVHFFSAYILIILGGVLLISPDNSDFTSSFTAVLSCISNVGPGLGRIGAGGYFGDFSAFSKIVFSMLMLVGRLEIYPILILFAPSAWKKI